MTDTPKPTLDDVLARESEVIAASRQLRGDIRAPGGSSPLIGLALSSGGIRSATFCLGVLQGLAASGLLRTIDYISCVGGGG
jgi:predicted acylesterase/phospholipase RssA